MKPQLFVSAAAAIVIAVLPAAAANAQNQSQPSRPNPPAPVVVLRPGITPIGPGAIPSGAGAIPMHNVGQMFPASRNPVSPPAPCPPQPPVLYPNGYYNGGGGGGNTTVIINNYPPVYDNGYYTGYNPGYSTGYSTGNTTYIAGGLSTSTVSSGVTINGPLIRRQTVRIGSGAAVTATLFSGYSTFWSSGQTVLSPFGAFYGTPAYIGTRYIITTPYPYVAAREIAVMPGLTVLGYDGAIYAPSALQTGTQPPSSANPVAAADPAASDLPAGITERKAALLRDALSDVRAFWVREDVRALRSRLLPSGTVAVFQNEKFVYSLRRADFLAVSSDALDRIQTRSLEFRRVAVRNDGLINAYAAHTYRVRGAAASASASPGDLRTATMRVTLVWDGSDWYVSAVSFAPGSLAR